MRVIFIGTVEFSRLTLQKLIELGVDVVGVVTRRHSPFNADFANLIPLCKNHNIPYLFIEDTDKGSEVAWIKKHNPDAIFCFGWSMLLHSDILSIPSKGVVGFHPAALPMNRGRHPMIWALALGLKETASTFFFIDEGTDSGDILSQRKIEITYEDNAEILYNKIAETALIQIEDFFPKLKNRTHEAIPQDRSKANYWRKRSSEDGKIDFRMSSRCVYYLVRALTGPYVGAHVDYRGQSVKIWKAQEVKAGRDNIEPGKVLGATKSGIIVKCGEGAVTLIEHEFSELPEVGEYL